jgi:hypothetical protein
MKKNAFISLIRFFVILAPIALLAGCMTKQSIVSSSDDFKPVSSQESQRPKYRIGLVMNRIIDNDVVRFVAQKEGLTYDFEFKVGKDIKKTLPIYLNSFVDTVPIKNISSGGIYDFVLDPKVTTSLLVYIGMSAAPRYELSIILDVPVIKNGSIKEQIIVRKDSRVEISAFENSDEKRTETMRKKYEEQITEIYHELEVILKDIFNPK